MSNNQESIHDNPSRIHNTRWRMPNKSERDQMSNAALDCEYWVKAPSNGKGSIKQQLHAANKALKGVPYWRIKEAFYGNAGSWGVAAYLQLRDAYDRWEAKQHEHLSAETRDAIARLSGLREHLARADASLHQEQIAALDYTLCRLSRGDT